MANQRYVVYENTQLPIGENTSIAEAKEALSKFYPAVAHAEGYIAEDGNIKFRVTGGSKGC